MTGRDRSADSLLDAVGAVGSELSALASGVASLRRRTEQLAALRRAEEDAAARIAQLERVLDFDRVAAHARGAVAEAALRSEPVPHLVAGDLLPPDVYRALVDAIPTPVFFDGRAEQGQELRVPPRLAPTSSLVAWTFVNEIVRRAISELLVERFAEPLAEWARERFPSLPPLGDWGVEITFLEGRLVRRTPGCPGGVRPDRPWDVLTGILFLARPQDTEEYGSRLAAASIPFRANSALVCVGPREAHAYEAIPAHASTGVERYTYEFGIGPTGRARRRLSAMSQGAPGS